MKWHNDPIQNSFIKIGLCGLSVFAFVGLSSIPGTNAYFSDSVTITGNSFSAGYWIPELEMKITPNHQNENGWYTQKQCIHLDARIRTSKQGVKTLYSLTESGDEATEMEYKEGCVKVEDGIWDFKAQAFNKDNEKWSSNIIAHKFKVDTINPEVNIDDFAHANLFGTEDIKGDFEDENFASYRLRIKKGDDEIYDSGAIDIDSEFDDKTLYAWNTEEVSNGIYEINLTGVDAAGNKGEDKINVRVENVAEIEDTENNVVNPGDVVINEIMWMGSTASTADEWVELRNMTTRQINLSGWKIENILSGSKILTIPDEKYIQPEGFFLISHFASTDTKSALSDIRANPDIIENNISIANTGRKDIVLRDSEGQKIDEARGDRPNGENGATKKSMERNNIPGDGLSPESWHTCVDERCNDGEYWKEADGPNYGTPGAPNHSENDPTATEIINDETPNEKTPEASVAEISNKPTNSVDSDSLSDQNQEATKKDDADINMPEAKEVAIEEVEETKEKGGEEELEPAQPTVTE